MIYLYGHQVEAEVTELVKLGFIRSYTKAQVFDCMQEIKESSVHVFVNPVDSDLANIQRISSIPSKIIILGHLPANIAKLLGMVIEALPEDVSLWDQCDAAPVYGFSESSARICYGSLPGALECQIVDRPLLRYDFAAEWNNLGYGHVRTDGSMWSLACKAKFVSSNDAQLASIYQGDEELTVYATISTQDQSEILWVNRPVGLVDTHEFRLFETFITNYKSDSLPCLPLIREIPYGYDAMISMRLDCDEDIASAGPLFELYKSQDVPFSLAVRTGQPIKEEDVTLINEVIDNGGGILSHSVNHKCNWGIDFDDVKNEAEKSRREILSLTDKINILEYAVSPFHQNPDYAVEALDVSGYKGFIGGIICNDQQYLISRGGKAAASLDIITHSQQCMLHGDCLLETGGDLLATFKQCVTYTVNSGAAFGYLDHPFSERYQYGWSSEDQRVSVHLGWIEYLKSFGSVLFVNENELLEYIQKKSNAKIWLKDGVIRSVFENNLSCYPLACEFKGTVSQII